MPLLDFETWIERSVREALEERGLKRGIDFVVQYPIRYSWIVDIAFPKQKVAIELDGEMWHNTAKARKRDSFKDITLKRGGWRVLRFWGYEIEQDLEGCIEQILEAI